MSPLGLDPAAKGGAAARARGRARVRVVAFVFVALFSGVTYKLFHMLPEPPPENEVQRAELKPKSETPLRPDFVDRNGELLAKDVRVAALAAHPTQIAKPLDTGRKLGRVLTDIDGEALGRQLQSAKERRTSFLWIKHQLAPREQQAVLRLGIPGLVQQPLQQRVYPKLEAASHLVGYVNAYNKGLAGLEANLEPGQALASRIGDSRIDLSIDFRVQQAVRDEMKVAMRRFRPKGACGIVMDMVTGELLSLVSLPEYDPHHASDAHRELKRNRCLDVYELGSVFKVVSHAMAIDSGKVSLGDRFDTTTSLRFNGMSIGDVHNKRRPQSIPEIFMNSSNIGTAKMTFAVGGADALRPFLEKLGFGTRPPLELPGLQSTGLPKRWPDAKTATVSYGHGYQVSPIQYVETVATLLGDGRRVNSTIFKDPSRRAAFGPQVVSMRTVETMRWLSWLVVAGGSGTKAKVDGYTLGGKTGTGEKAERGRYRRDLVIASFVGVFPLEQPRYVVYLMLDEAKGDQQSKGLRYGGWTAAPIVGSIVSRIGPMLGVVPEGDTQLRARYRERYEQLKTGIASLEKERRLAVVTAGR